MRWWRSMDVQISPGSLLRYGTAPGGYGRACSAAEHDEAYLPLHCVEICCELVVCRSRMMSCRIEGSYRASSRRRRSELSM